MFNDAATEYYISICDPFIRYLFVYAYRCSYTIGIDTKVSE